MVPKAVPGERRSKNPSKRYPVRTVRFTIAVAMTTGRGRSRNKETPLA